MVIHGDATADPGLGRPRDRPRDPGRGAAGDRGHGARSAAGRLAADRRCDRRRRGARRGGHRHCSPTGPKGHTEPMSILFREKARMIEPDRRASGAIGVDAGPGAPLRARHAAGAAVSRRGSSRRVLRARLLLGRRAQVLAGAGRVHDGGRLRRRLHAEPDVRGGVLGHRPVTPRSCSSCSIRRRSRTSRSCGCSGRATTRRRACARATTSAPSTARRSTRPATSSASAAEASKAMYQRELRAAGHGTITTEIAPAGRSTTPRTTTSSTSRRVPNGYCGLGGTGVSCPVGLAT